MRKYKIIAMPDLFRHLWTPQQVRGGILAYMAVLILLNNTVIAETITDNSQPVEISAAKSLEWDRKAKTYTAREKVVATQGTAKIQSDTLTARYNDDNGAADISTLEARSNVIIQSPPYTAYGDHAVYHVKTGRATLTGKAMKITTEADVMTAQDKIEFFGAENRLVATGEATALHEGNTLIADRLGAYFAKDRTGKLAATKITASGNVTIKTPRENITGDEGAYDIPAQKAVLTGRVRIRQGKNWLEGTRANIDMATGISQLLGGGNAETGTRVKGVFFPSTAKEKESPEKE